MALAGELATEWGILPWQTGEATSAGEIVLAWWINRRGGSGSTEESQHVRAVRAYLSEFGASRFVALDADKGQAGSSKWVERHPDRPIASRSGWRRASVGAGGGDEYLIGRDGWHSLCAASGADPLEVAKTLSASGHLAAGDGKNVTKVCRLPGFGRVRCYVVLPSIFAEDAADSVGEAA